MTKCRDICFWETLLVYFGGEVRSENRFGVSPYIRKKIFEALIYLAFLILTNFRVILGFFGAVSGFFGVRVGSENYFGVYSYIISTFVFWVTQNSLHFQYWPIQGHLGLFVTIFGSFRVGVRLEICIGVSSYIKKIIV